LRASFLLDLAFSSAFALDVRLPLRRASQTLRSFGLPIPWNPTAVARAIWSGSIVFGLVNAPVRLYSAISEHDPELHLIHVKDGSRIGYVKVCKKEEKPVPDDEIAKGHETNGKVVLLEDEDFAAARGEGTRTIEIKEFVPYEQIDPIYFERTYYVGPQDGADKVYTLLVEAMEEAGLAAIVTFFFRDREQLGCLRVRDGILLIEKMYYADEIRPDDDARPGRRSKADKKELEMALSLIESFEGELKLDRYKDTYHERLLDVIRRKRKGETIEAPELEEPEAPVDLLAALRESVEQAKRRSGSKRGASRNGHELDELPVAELTKRAKKLGIEGRSKMSKRELVGAIEKAER
jgi:DNA end-binding protein Ku